MSVIILQCHQDRTTSVKAGKQKVNPADAINIKNHEKERKRESFGSRSGACKR